MTQRYHSLQQKLEKNKKDRSLQNMCYTLPLMQGQYVIISYLWIHMIKDQYLTIFSALHIKQQKSMPERIVRREEP